MSQTRRIFVMSALAAGAATRVARAQARTTLRLSSSPDDDVSSVLYAIDGGLFKRAGLDVTITRGNSGAAIAAGVVGGAIDIGKSSVVALISAHQRGLPIQIVCGAALYTAQNPLVAMIVAKDSPIKGPRDIPGKVVAVPALNDLYAIANAAMIDQAGGDWKSVKYVELPTAASPDALLAKRVDAVSLTTPTLLSAMDTGKFRIVGYPFSSIAHRFVQAGWFSNKDFIDRNIDALATFRHVVAQSAALINKDKALSNGPLATFSGEDPAEIARMPRAVAIGPINASLLQPPIDAAFKYGAIKASFPAADLLAPGVEV